MSTSAEILNSRAGRVVDKKLNFLNAAEDYAALIPYLVSDAEKPHYPSAVSGRLGFQ
jgi:hypothetical protein